MRVVPQCGLPPLGWPAAPLSAHLPSTPSTFSPRLFLSIRFATLIYVPNAAVGRGWRDHQLACEPSRATRSLAPTGPSLPLSRPLSHPVFCQKFRRNSVEIPLSLPSASTVSSLETENRYGDLARFDETTIVRRNVRGRGDGWLLPTATSLPCRRHEPHPRTTISSSVPLQISREGIGETGRGERRL